MPTHDLNLHPSVSAALREQAAAIYSAFCAGNISAASAMLNQVPHERTAYVVFTLTVHAINDGFQFPMSKFIKQVTS